MPGLDRLVDQIAISTGNTPDRLLEWADELHSSLTLKQLEFIQDPAKRKAALCSRKAGKTQAIIRWLLETCIRTPNSVCVYLATTFASANKLIWNNPEGLPTLVRRAGFEGLIDVNESEHRLTFPNGSVLWVTGADTMRHAMDWLGVACELVVIDESQEFPDEILNALVFRCFSPARVVRQGTICLTGTPHPACSGTFFDITTHTKPGWSVKEWTLFDNTYLPHARQFVIDECNSRALSLTDPIIQREFFGKWVRDINLLLYQYMTPRNDFNGVLPDLSIAPRGRAYEWSHVIGLDFGYEDMFTLVASSWSLGCPTTYIRAIDGEQHCDVTRASELITNMLVKFPNARLIADAGALGKMICAELVNRKGLPIEASEKREKPTFIKLMNDALRLGTLRVDPIACAALVAQWNKLQRDPKTLIEKAGQPADYADSALYGWRFSYSYCHEPADAPLTQEQQIAKRQQEAWERTVKQYEEPEETTEREGDEWASQEGIY